MEQLNINTYGLYVGKQIFYREAWYTVVMMVPGTVWVSKS